MYHICLVSTLILITKYNISRIFSYFIFTFYLLSFIIYLLYPNTFYLYKAPSPIWTVSDQLFSHSLSESVSSLSPFDYFLFRFFWIFREYMWVWRGIPRISIVNFQCDIYTLTCFQWWPSYYLIMLVQKFSIVDSPLYC